MTVALRQRPLTRLVRNIVQRDNGAWFDPEDMSTMFQDAAGTTPVTALEQPVGLWLDKSGNGNHATQAITASRPTLSARYNWLLNSATLSTQSVTTVAAPYTLSFTGTGSVTLSGSATGTLVGTGANNRVSLAFTPTAGTLTLTVTGSVTLAMLALGALTTYQAITAATNYDSAGWSRYLRFDGIDDFLNLPNMGLYANGSASVVAALSNSSADAEIVAEANNANIVPFYRPIKQLSAGSKGPTYRNDAAVLTAPAVIASPANLSIRIVSCVDNGINFNLRDGINGQSANVPYIRGITTLINTTIGALVRTTKSSYHSGPMYGLIITKSALSDTDRRRCEQFLASRLSQLGVTLS